MKLCRYQQGTSFPRIGLLLEDAVLDLTAEGIDRLSSLLEFDGLIPQLTALAGQNLPRVPLTGVKLLSPVEQQEVWAVGVTYLRSKKARMEESDFSATAYDRVYEAGRPELFFKALPEKVVPPGDAVGIRRDAKWNVPEPELVLAVNSRGKLVGYSIGNDMSSRDIEGENLLYLHRRKFTTVPAPSAPASSSGRRKRRRGPGRSGCGLSAADRWRLPARLPWARSSAPSRNWWATCSAARRSRTAW